MSSSSASQTSARAEVLGRERLARQAVLADERGRLGRASSRAWARPKPSTIARQARRCSPVADDPLEQPAVLVGHVERRVAGADPARRVGEPQQVAVRPAVALPVLDRLVGERVGRRVGVPARRPRGAAPRPQPRKPSTNVRELEQVRAGAADLRQRGERRLARGLVADAGRHARARRGPGRSSARGPPRLTRDDRGDRARRRRPAMQRSTRLGVLAGQLPLAGVVAAALASRGSGSGRSRAQSSTAQA